MCGGVGAGAEGGGSAGDSVHLKPEMAQTVHFSKHATLTEKRPSNQGLEPEMLASRDKKVTSGPRVLSRIQSPPYGRGCTFRQSSDS